MSAKTAKDTSRLRFPTNIASSLILAASILAVYYLSPGWNPLSGKSASTAARYATWVSHAGCFYLFLQAGQFIVGRIGTSGEFWAETIASMLPIIAVVWIVASEYRATESMSLWVSMLVEQTFFFGMCDLIILGSVGAAINRLTDEYHAEP